MGNIQDDLLLWFRERPLAMQDAARRILDKGILDENDYSDLLKICGSEVGMSFDGVRIPTAQSIPSSAFSKHSHSHRVEITSISNVLGINALGPRKPLILPSGLTVIYGHNGSGKSGYTRLLKQVCGSKNPGTLHRNAFVSGESGQSCRIEYKYDGKTEELNWDISNGVSDQLSAIELYDSSCGSIYVTDENQLAYEPPLLKLMSDLIFVCDSLSRKFDDETNKLVSSKPLLPTEYVNTKLGKWYSSISANTKELTIDKNCVWSGADQESLENLTARLKMPDAKAEANKIRKSQKQLEKLIAGFRNWKGKLSNESISKYFAFKKDYEIKQRTASEYAKSVFESSPLNGIGEDSWKLLWEKARDYSESLAYSDLKFPNLSDGAVCVLCQQPLEDEAKIRLSGFEGFVKGELESSAKVASDLLKEAKELLLKTPDEELISSFISASGIDEVISKEVHLLRTNIVSKASDILGAKNIDDLISDIDFSVLDKLILFSKNKLESASQLDKDAEKDMREKIKNELVELNARKWVSQQKESINKEIGRLYKISIIRKAKSSIGTTALTRKKSVLAEELVSSEYIRRFQNELNLLGAGRINAKLEKTRSRKGRVYFQIKLEGNKRRLPIGQILSDGEFRIISIAAFLADVEGHEDKSTFIFDDPISSLDQDYEESVAKRLVDLSKHRQVLVFTHRLSLMALLEEVIKKQGLTHNLIGLYKESWGAGEPGLPPIHAQKTKAAINTLISKIPEGRKILNEQGTESYSWWAKSMCSNIRITIEKVVEFDLLADVVQRFRRPINTQGKLINIAKVTEEDCHYIDKLMTKFSRYEHSQPTETPVYPPDLDELENDLNELKVWRDRFTR